MKKWHSCLCKIKRIIRLLENQDGIKIVRVKIGFFLSLFENWGLENYLEIEALGIEFKNGNFGS